MRWSRIELLAASFRVRARPALDVPAGEAKEALLGARALLKRVNSAPSVVHLVNAESGDGKTALGMTLALLREPLRRDVLVPLYIDLGAVTTDQPLRELDEVLRRLAKAEFGGLSGYPLIVLDGPNEAVEPGELIRLLAVKRAALDAVGARLLFLFSFRHRSYPGALRSALIAHGYEQLDTFELLFDAQDNTDLKYLRELLPGRSRWPPRTESEDLTVAVRAYDNAFPNGPKSRTTVSAFVEWRMSSDDDSDAPSPAQLLFAKAISRAIGPSAALRALGHVAFLLLGEERTTVPYEAIERQLGIAEEYLREELPATGFGDDVECAAGHLRFKSEKTIRALGGLHVARALTDGVSPGVLRGRTRYDVCAPYVLPALRWLTATRTSSTQAAISQTLNAVAVIIAEELDGVDAPYSFYATVLCCGDGAVLGMAVDKLNERLFHSMVVAIDKDRVESCRDSLKGAGERGVEIGVAPVLDQLFEVVRIYRSAAAGLLRTIMNDSTALIRSQGAYLLNAWVSRASSANTSSDREALLRISEGMNGNDSNLHFRFHQVELLENLLRCFPDEEDANRRRILSVLGAIAHSPGEVPNPDPTSSLYGEFQAFISLRAGEAVRPSSDRSRTQFRASLGHCLKRLTELKDFRTIGSGEDAETLLECWEIALALAAREAAGTSESLPFVRFIERSLTHDFWIVRWWGFANLIGLLRAVDGGGSQVLAQRCAENIARQLCTSIEPMGLKHRECALVAELLDARPREPNSSRTLATALRFRARQSLHPQARIRFSQAYYEALDVPPDDYLWEYWRRLEEIVPAAPST
jgi:hypothetical protein